MIKFWVKSNRNQSNIFLKYFTLYIYVVYIRWSRYQKHWSLYKSKFQKFSNNKNTYSYQRIWRIFVHASNLQDNNVKKIHDLNWLQTRKVHYHIEVFFFSIQCVSQVLEKDINLFKCSHVGARYTVRYYIIAWI